MLYIILGGLSLGIGSSMLGKTLIEKIAYLLFGFGIVFPVIGQMAGK